jgi:hypothetical protein
MRRKGHESRVSGAIVRSLSFTSDHWQFAIHAKLSERTQTVRVNVLSSARSHASARTVAVAGMRSKAAIDANY